MTLPTLFFALMTALFYGAFYHLIRGGSFWRLLLYLFLSVFGFALGHFLGVWRGWVLFPIGTLNLGLSSLGSLLILIFGDWLTRFETNQESKV